MYCRDKNASGVIRVIIVGSEEELRRGHVQRRRLEHACAHACTYICTHTYILTKNALEYGVQEQGQARLKQARALARMYVRLCAHVCVHAHILLLPFFPLLSSLPRVIRAILPISLTFFCVSAGRLPANLPRFAVKTAEEVDWARRRSDSCENK